MTRHEGHETVICSKCDRVIEQCSCPADADKLNRYIICDDCQKEVTQLDLVSRAAEVAAASLLDLVSVIEQHFVKPKASVKENENARD
jgi:hypothetical protein